MEPLPPIIDSASVQNRGSDSLALHHPQSGGITKSHHPSFHEHVSKHAQKHQADGKHHHPFKQGKGALSDQSAGFLQTPMCLAINIGDLKGLERLLSSKPDLVCDRGPFGETILHVAILKKKADIAEWIIERYGDDYIPVLQESLQVTEIRLCEISYGQGVKVDGTPYGHQYNGETALHQACKNGMLTVVKLLVDKKVNANVEANGISFQEYSTSWEYPNLYSGSTPLHFAATRRDTLEIIKLLVEKGGADIYRKDQYGNNILHVMAYFGIFNETYQYIVKRNDADLMKGVTKTKLITQDNNHGLTPAMLGLSLGYCSMIEALKEPQWEFGDDIWYYAVPLDDICPILHQKKYGTDTLSKPILVSIVDRWDHDMITHPIFRSIIRVKWDVYARRYFMRQFFVSAVTVILFTISVGLDSGAKAQVTQTTRDVQYGLVVATFVLVFFQVYDVIHDYYELYKRTKFRPKHLRNIKLSFWKSLDERLDYVWTMIRADIDEDVIRVVFSVCVMITFALSTAARFNTSIDLSALPKIQAVAAIFGWLHILYYARGIKSVGPLILVLRQVVTRGFMHWIVIYITTVIGFSSAFYSIMKNMDYAAKGLDIANDWNYYSGAVLWTVRFLFSMEDFSNLRGVAGDFGILLFLVHQFCVVIILLNVLVALLVDIFVLISKHYESQWLLQMARTVINIDRDLSRYDKDILEQQFGFHRHPIEIKRALSGLVHPLSSENLNVSADTLRDGKSLKISKQEFTSTATISPEDPRHFFMFLDQSMVIVVDGEQSTETKTVRLVTGVYKTADGQEDVEVKVDDMYWSLKKVLWDLGRLFSRQAEDIWVAVGKGL